MRTQLVCTSALIVLSACANPIHGTISSPSATPQGQISTPKIPKVTAQKREWYTPAPTRAVKRKPGDPPEPIVLMHGMAGWKRVAGVDYFNGVATEIEKAGYPVYSTEVDPFNSVDARGKQVAKQLDAILKKTGAKKVHLVGHSQGGLDARYVVATLGYADRVTTVTTVGTPHQGTALSDIVYGKMPGPARAAITGLLNAFLGSATGRKADLEAQMKNLSQKHSRGVFNPANPDQPDVDYYSYTGKTQGNPIVDEDSVDVVHPALLATYQLLKNQEGNNDGLVSVYSAMWGTYLGAFPADHFDEVGQPVGAGRVSFNHKQFYVDLAKFLHGDAPAPRGEP
ncbi:MAG: alpha/beta fold hydrolase [Myxococcota bacterium]